VLAAQKLKMDEVPCIIADDLTESEIREYRLLDNKLAQLAEDNLENIHFELDELDSDELNELYEYDPIQLDPEKEAIEDDAPEAQEAKVIEL
jgi:ParB-like chromosome segregation protein Spo0J